MSDEEQVNNKLTPEYLRAFEYGFAAGLFYQKRRSKLRSDLRAYQALFEKLNDDQVKYAICAKDIANATRIAHKLGSVTRTLRNLNEIELKAEEAEKKKKEEKRKKKNV